MDRRFHGRLPRPLGPIRRRPGRGRHHSLGFGTGRQCNGHRAYRRQPYQTAQRRTPRRLDRRRRFAGRVGRRTARYPGRTVRHPAGTDPPQPRPASRRRHLARRTSGSARHDGHLGRHRLRPAAYPAPVRRRCRSRYRVHPDSRRPRNRRIRRRRLQTSLHRRSGERQHTSVQLPAPFRR